MYPHVARLELCQRLAHVSRWHDTLWSWYCDESVDDTPIVNLSEHLKVIGGVGYFTRQYPAYDLGYLLRMLPKMGVISLYSIIGASWEAVYQGPEGYGPHFYDQRFQEETPEDALCKLAIRLWEDHILE